MADSDDKSPDFLLGDLREVTLRIPGEHFFCESFNLPRNVLSRREGDDKDPIAFGMRVNKFVKEILDDPSFLLIHQTSWHGDIILYRKWESFNFRNSLK